MGKCSSRITISRYARNDRVENGYPVHHTKNVWETRSSRIVIPSEAEGSFSLAVRGSVPDSEKWETLYRRKGGDGASPKRLSEGGGKRETKKISRCARNDSVGNGYLVHHAKKECVGNAASVSSSRAKPRDLFRWRQEGECLAARNGKRRIAERR